MYTPIDICNEALGAIGETPIASFNIAGRVENACARLYEPTRKLVNGLAWWAFAMRRVASLAREAGAPATEHLYAYAMPADCLRLYEVGVAGESYAVEGRSILTNATVVTLRYIADVPDLTRWHPMARYVLRDWMASELAGPVKRSMELRAALQSGAFEMLRMAASSDACEAEPQTIGTDGTFEAARWG